ncbi:MAG: hypothetical protein ACMG57_03825 [Candidatus Dojkabacteria bacterium]
MPETFQEVTIDVDHGNFNPGQKLWEMIDGKRAILGDQLCTVNYNSESETLILSLDEGGTITVKPTDLASFGKFGMGAFEIKIKGNINKKLRISGLDVFSDKEQ